MNDIRWGILGCGRIAHKFANDLQLAGGGKLTALASRSLENAKEFSEKFPAQYIHGNYEELVNNPDVDIIYIATPHGLHHEHALLCLNHKKAVLCEKAFAMNSRQVSEMIDAARKNNVFLMEAMWTKFVPHYLTTMSMINEGKLGKIRSMQVNFGFATDPSFPQRLFKPALGGGTLMDIGIYNVFLTLSVLGMPDEIDAWMKPSKEGIDEQMAVVFRYNDGSFSQMLSSFLTNLGTEADINGEKGRIKLTSRFYEPISTSIEFFPGRPDSKENIPFEKESGWGYQYQIRHAHDCLHKGLNESPVMSLKDSLQLMNTLDAIRAKAGLVYDADKG
ncbi:Gfo/Idh/MocA family oxidoreductase [Pollutibacter soli]|uniref:Gfo/Idh/MocA family protein n=1 Tax=Pollutibacter soli TaxID=3034157 RepID=UPI00301407B0